MAGPAPSATPSSVRHPVIWFLLLASPACAQSYVRDVYPIWEKHCLGCHASGTKMGSLDIETWEGLQRGGNHGTILVPGSTSESRLYTMLIGETKPAMPMDGQVLSPAELETVRKWIAAGATPPSAREIAMLQARANGETTAAVAAGHPPPSPQMASLAWRPGTMDLAVSHPRTVDLLNPVTRQVLATFTGHPGPIHALAFSRDGQRLAAAGAGPEGQGQLVLWDVERKAILAKFSGHRNAIRSLAFSSDGQWLATAAGDRQIKLWSTSGGEELHSWDGHHDAVSALAFTPDNGRLISGSVDGTVKIWNPATGAQLYSLAEGTAGINALAMSPDGKHIAAAGLDRHIRIWELGAQSGRLIRSVLAHTEAIMTLAWSPDGADIISSAADQTLKTFGAADLKEKRSWPVPSGWFPAIAFSKDGARIAVSRSDGSFALLEK